MHREYFDSIVQLIRNGGSLSSCTSKVLTSGTFVVERQYASKVSWSQFLGTPLLSGVEARVTESRTVIRILFFSEEAFANTASNRRPACKAAILRILIRPTPPNAAMHLSHARFSRTILERRLTDAVHCAPPSVSRTSFRWRKSANKTHLRAVARVEPALFVGDQCP